MPALFGRSCGAGVWLDAGTAGAHSAAAPVSCGDVGFAVDQQAANVEIALAGSVNQRSLLVAGGRRRRHFAKKQQGSLFVMKIMIAVVVSITMIIIVVDDNNNIIIIVVDDNNYSSNNSNNNNSSSNNNSNHNISNRIAGSNHLRVVAQGSALCCSSRRLMSMRPC
jgi:hypothetical protein